MIAVLGESGCGRSSLVKSFVEKNPKYHNIVLYTTRPKRPDEKDGVDYHFVSEKAFEKLIKNDFLLVAEVWRGWFYGIPAEECKSDKAICTITPSMFRLIKKLGYDVSSVYLYVDRRSRLINILSRGDDIDEAYRRNLSDVGQYYGLVNETDFIITNTEYHMNLDEAVLAFKEVVDLIDEDGDKE